MSEIRYKSRPKPEGLELTASQIESIKRVLTDAEDKYRAVLEWRTPENLEAAARADQSVAQWVRPLLHDYLILIDALAPFGAVWDAWVIERLKPGSIFENFNRFAVYMLNDAYKNHFRNATEIYDDLPIDDMPTGGQLWEAGYAGDEL